jgi:hypothetical protein
MNSCIILGIRVPIHSDTFLSAVTSQSPKEEKIRAQENKGRRSSISTEDQEKAILGQIGCWW